MKTVPLQTHDIPIDELDELARNPRVHDERNLSEIAASLERFGQVRPVCSWLREDGSRTIVAGHGTVAAAKSLGWETIVVADHRFASEAEAEAYAVADNRTTELSFWDQPTLRAIMDDLQGDVDGIGFDDNEIAALMAEVGADGDMGAEVLDAAPGDTGGIRLSPAERQEGFEQAGIRSLILPFPSADYEWVVGAMAELRKTYECDTNSEALQALLRENVGA